MTRGRDNTDQASAMISSKTTAGLIERGHNKAERKIEFYFRGIKFCFQFVKIAENELKSSMSLGARICKIRHSGFRCSLVQVYFTTG